MVMMTLPTALPEPGSSRSLPTAPPSVLAVVEMNLEEFPAFRLGRRSRRTELRYVRSRPAPDGRILEQTWTVRGAEGLGLPGPFEQDLYVGLLVLYTEQGLPDDGRIRFTRNRLAQVLGISNSGRGYELIEQGLARLAGATVQTEHSFVRPAPLGPGRERTGPLERLSLTFHVLEEVRVYERAAVAPARLGDSRDDAEGAPEGRVQEVRPFELSVARLGAPLVQGYERRYTKGLDATFYFQLGGPLSRRLYRYLDKVRNGRGSFEIGLRGLGDVLGLEYRYPSDIKVGLAETHEELRATGYLSGMQYLPMAGGPGAGEKVAYAFDPAFDARPRRRAGAVGAVPPGAATATPPTLLSHADRASGGVPTPLSRADRAGEATPTPLTRESGGGAGGVHGPAVLESAADTAASRIATLESFGVTAARARHLVANFPGAHVDAQVAALRDRLERAQAGHGRVPAPRNPAGYLAQAIVDGFATSAPRLMLVERTPEVAPTVEARVLPSPASAGEGQGVGASPPAPAALPEGPPDFVATCAELRDALSAATYGAWVATLLPGDASAMEPDAADGAGSPDGAAAAGAADLRPVVVMRVPTRFALARWDRDPLAGALAAAEASLGVRVRLVLA